MTRTLFRPVGPTELRLIAESDWRGFPPRLPEQPIFYPVDNETYARKIARDWNVKASGSGYVVRFDIDETYLARYPIRRVGSNVHLEYWIPAEELTAFNEHIVGRIELIASYPEPEQAPAPPE